MWFFRRGKDLSVEKEEGGTPSFSLTMEDH